MISYKNKYKGILDFIILIFATFNSILFPLQLGFEPDFMNGIEYEIFNLIIDLIFLLDIIL